MTQTYDVLRMYSWRLAQVQYYSSWRFEWVQLTFFVRRNSRRLAHVHVTFSIHTADAFRELSWHFCALTAEQSHSKILTVQILHVFAEISVQQVCYETFKHRKVVIIHLAHLLKSLLPIQIRHVLLTRRNGFSFISHFLLTLLESQSKYKALLWYFTCSEAKTEQILKEKQIGF